MPSKSRRPAGRVPDSPPPAKRDSRRSVPNGREAPPNGQAANGAHHRQPPPRRRSNGAHGTPPRPSSGENGSRTGANGVASSLPAATAVQTVVDGGESTVAAESVHDMWQTSEIDLSHPQLRPSSSHSLRQMTARRSRSSMWTTLAVVMIAAALTVALLTVIGGSEQGHAQARAAVSSAAAIAAGAVENSVDALDSLRAESSFTPELVASISALGDASRSLVESAAALPTDETSLAEARMLATGLAGRVSRLGETFGAAFSYRGQVEPHLTFPSLNDPVSISHLSENTTLLTDWQFRLEQAASTRPNQPRLLKNQQALESMLPYIAVHRQAYTDAVGAGQSEQAVAALAQINSLLSAIRQDFDRAYGEVTDMAQAEIHSLAVDLQVLSKGT